ncbi:MAG: metallophosphoesterase [Phycisphaerales bacterium]|nr:metallophosphoesterase [Phycisphaerales bacterium]
MGSTTRRGIAARVTTLLTAAMIICAPSVVPGRGQSAIAQQPDRSQAPSRDEPVPSGARGRGEGRRGLLAEMTAFKTDVPSRSLDVVLARPTPTSIAVSVACYEPGPSEGYIEFRRDDAAPITKTAVQPLPTGKPILFTLDGLSPDTAYVYRVRCRRAAGGDGKPGEFVSTEDFTFHTPRASGRAFSFTVQADSHLDQGVEPKCYEQTLANMLAAKPDFMIDLGDTFMTDKRGKEFKSALPQYDAQRYYFSRVAHSVPLFMVLGNHDGEKGTSGTGADDIGPWSYAQRTSRFPPPLTGAGPLADGTFYTGATAMNDGVGSNYYAFEWGDALCIVLDPYWSTAQRIRGGGGRGAGGGSAQRPNDDPLKPTDSSWTSTLGRTQYDWLTKTLEATHAKYRFVFIHHLVGGMGGAESRGGVESSPYFEWGGKNADGTPGFAQHRIGWPMPIHDLLVKHHVSAVFHGHDHLYVSSQRDGVVYQCVPQPGNPRGNTRSATQYGYTSGTLHASPGHVRVRIDADNATVEFIRTAVDRPDDTRPRDRRAAEPNGTVVHTYSIPPAKRK